MFEKKLSHLIKRDGSVKDFDANKIVAAIAKAGKATGEFDESRAARITEERVLPSLVALNLVTPHIEQVQDAVERALFEEGFFKTLRAYIVYREQRQKARDARQSWVNVESSINEYLQQLDWRVNANANQGYSLGGLILNVSGKVVANYWLNYIYPAEIGRAHREADFHIHDLDMLSGYCAGWSLRTLLTEGLNGVPGKVEAGAPKHLSSATGQIVNFLGTMQNEWAGAQAFSSFDTYLAPFIKKDNVPYEEVLQSIQELIYNLNVPSRWGTQTPFTNLTFDWTCPEDLKDQHPIIGDSENADRLFAMTAKYGLPYFQNFINSELKPNMIRSMCCRLQLDLRELLKRGNGLFGSAEQTGSLGVVTINCARLGYLFKGNEQGLFDRLDHLLDLAKTSLEIKRKVIQRHIDQGLFPYTKRYLGTLRNHFSTIGVNGINECIRNFTNDANDITDDWGHAFALKLLDHVRARMVEFQEETGHMYNLEATPAEGTTYRFAKEDRKRFPDIIQAGTESNPYYTNSSQLPVGFTDDPFLALEMQDDLQRKYTGGTVLHLYMADAISSSKACKELVRRALSRFRLPYLTVTPTFSICPKHGYISGRHDFCPICDAELIRAKKAQAACQKADC